MREALIAVGTQDSARLVASMKTMDMLLPGADLNRHRGGNGLEHTAELEVAVLDVDLTGISVADDRLVAAVGRVDPGFHG